MINLKILAQIMPTTNNNFDRIIHQDVKKELLHTQIRLYKLHIQSCEVVQCDWYHDKISIIIMTMLYS